eukprot:INCI6401.1.p1 GENE.INCI6401.1~~INCI6401.1.p1  ORF type:complete len:809 (+),score=118.24 INCI6401.1:198-2429(+)
MGNEQGTLALTSQLEPAAVPNLFLSAQAGDPASLLELKKLLKATNQAFLDFRTDAECASDEDDPNSAGGDSSVSKKISMKGFNALFKAPAERLAGTKCVFWRSSPLGTPAFVETRIRSVSLKGQTPSSSLFGQTAEAERNNPDAVAVLETGDQMDVVHLFRCVRRVGKAIAIEKDWIKKLRRAHLVEGATVDLWVPTNFDSNPPSATTATGRSSSQTKRESPRAARHKSRSANARIAGGWDNSESSDSSEDAPHSAADAPLSFHAKPGQLHSFKISSVQIQWNYRDTMVSLEATRCSVDGTKHAPQLFSGCDALAMVEAAKPARELLDRLLRRTALNDGIAIGARVDIWLEEEGRAVRGVVAGIDHRFISPTTIELRPCIVYSAPSQGKVARVFEDYASFVTSWKQAKYIVEQQTMLEQDALTQGVTRGSWIFVEQAPKSARWPFKTPGALDAQVQSLRFDFDRDQNKVTLLVQIRYQNQGFRGAAATSPHEKLRRRVTIASNDDAASEWVAWDTLRALLRSKVSVSNICCLELTAATRKEFKPYIKFVLGDCKRKTPPALLTVDGKTFLGRSAKFGTPSNWIWDDLQCSFREGEIGNRRGAHRSRKPRDEIDYGRRRSVTSMHGNDGDSDDDSDDESSSVGSVVSAQASGSGDSLDTHAAAVNQFLNQVLEIRVYADKKMGPKSFLGMAEVHLRHLLPSGQIEQTKILGPSKSKRHFGRGKISVTVSATGPGIICEHRILSE